MFGPVEPIRVDPKEDFSDVIERIFPGEEIDGQYVYRVPSERYLMGGPKAVTETAIKKTLAHQKERKKDDNERSL